MDLRAEAPSAFDLAEAARQSQLSSFEGRGAWDYLGWHLPGALEAAAATAKLLPGLTALMEYWTPWFQGGRWPGEEFRHAILERWPPPSRVNQLLVEALEAAREADDSRIVRNELKNISRERRSGETEEVRGFYEVLDAALRDLRRIEKDEGAFMVHPNTLPKAKWTVHNLIVFLETHWALRRVHLALSQSPEAVSAKQLAARLSHAPRLGPEDAETFADDIEELRSQASSEPDPWE